ncbi:MAG: hypothetical protein ABR599_10620 [Gemmatimonadota bacterium]
MSEQLAVLKIVATRLEGAAIPYMVSGSTALSYYVQPRMTRDIDIVADVAVARAEELAELFEADFYCDRAAIRRAIGERGTFNLVHLAFIVKVDFIVRKDSPYRREEFARRRRVRVDGTPIVLVAAEDLLLSKLASAKESRSEIQLADACILAESVREIDWPYIERWAASLTLTELLAEVRA